MHRLLQKEDTHMISKQIVIGITGTGSLVGQAIIKAINMSSFKDRVELIGMDYFRENVGSYWCSKNFILPDLLKNELVPIWLDKIIQIVKENKIQILFIGVDFELMYFSIYKEIIENETLCRIIVSNKEVIEIADDKYLTYEFLKNNELNYPATHLYKHVKNLRIEYPCIIKPRVGYRSRGVFIIGSERELKSMGSDIDNPIVQELIGDDNTEYTCGLVYLDKYISSIVLRRQLKEGNTSVAIYDHDTPDIIYSYIKDIADSLKPYGACNFQLRTDGNGIPKLFEINARHSGTTFMRTLFGFNEVEMIIGNIFGIQIPKMELREGKVIRYYDEFFAPDSLK